MDKKWWDAEQRLCESHGLHTLAQCAHDIGHEVTVVKSPEQRAREYLAEVEQRVRRSFSKPGTPRLVYSVKGKQNA